MVVVLLCVVVLKKSCDDGLASLSYLCVCACVCCLCFVWWWCGAAVACVSVCVCERERVFVYRMCGEKRKTVKRYFVLTTTQRRKRGEGIVPFFFCESCQIRLVN